MLRSFQKDNLSTSHDYRKPLFTGFLELSDVVESCKKCGISNTQATYMQQSYLNSKDFKRDVFFTKERHLFLFIFRFYWLHLLAPSHPNEYKLFSVIVIAPACPTIFLIVVWSTWASASINIQVWRQQCVVLSKA